MSTLLNEMKRKGRDCRFGIVSMCIGIPLSPSFLCVLIHLHTFMRLLYFLTGSGMGAAAVFERGDGVDDLSNARICQSPNFLSKDAF